MHKAGLGTSLVLVLVCLGAFLPAVARAEEPVSHLSLLADYGKDIGKQKLFSSTNGDKFDWRKAPSVHTLNDDLIFVPTERGLQVEVTPTVEKWWRLTMVPPEGSRFAPGHYSRVQSRFNSSSPDVAWFHITSAETCEAPGGHMDVLQAEYGPDGMPTVFAATFVQVCAGQALQGAISLGLPDPPSLPSFEPEPATLTINVPAGTSLSPAGSYTFSTVAGDRLYRELNAGGVTVSPHGEWNVKLTSPDLKMAGTQPLFLPNVEIGGAGHSCNNPSQPKITVHEFLRGPDDNFRETIVRLVTDFELLCDGVRVRGNITIGKPNPTVPDLNSGGAGHPPSSLVMYGRGFITKGQALDFSTQRLDNLRWTTDGNRVFTYVRGAGGVMYSLNLAAPRGETLRPGRYLRASRYPFNAPGSPGMGVSGDGRGCGSYQGFFDVKQADFTAGGKLEHFVATFEFHCESTQGDVLRGEMRLGVAGQPPMPTLPTELPEASLTVTRGWGRDFGTETRHLSTSNGWFFSVETFEPVALPGYLYVSASSQGSETVGFHIRRPDFDSRIGPLTPGDYDASQSDATNLSFHFLGWGGAGCSEGTGSVRVREAEYAQTDSFPRALERFRGDFQYECGIDQTFRGEFTFELPESTPQHGEPTGWGYNGFGEVGPKANDVQPAASPVDGIGPVKQVSAGYLHSLALKEDGTVWAWGWNGLGQLGDGTTADRRTPVQVKGLTDIVSVSAGAFHSLAVRRDGTLWAWGWNAYGQLGTGTTLDHVKPVQVPGIRATDASAGYLHSLAIGTDKKVRAWGWNGFGQLGDGTLTDRRTPVVVSGLANGSGVSAGWFHSLAINNGYVAAWGWNGLGQLGTGDTLDRLLPVRPPELTQVHTDTVSAGFGHSLSRSFHGNSTYAWGWNAFGQLGDGSTVDRTTPVRIALPSGMKFRRISAGMLSSVGDGASVAYAWGYNGLGQVGDTTTADKLVPTQVPGTLGVFDVSAGGLHTLVAGFKTGWQAPPG
jgi:alpha-tubulin suppressor-like RCC1 family protein